MTAAQTTVPAALPEAASSPAPRDRVEAAGPIPVAVPRAVRAAGRTLAIDVARTHEEIAMCFAIRSAVFIGEQECPYDEEFDGNDFAATHVLARVDGEPAATVRLRWFDGWFKHERTAVMRPFRSLGVGRATVRWSLDLARRKGYRLGYGHAQLDILDYWTSIEGVSEIPGLRFSFSDHAYAAIRFDLEPDAAAPAMTDDPLVLNRPEGLWHRPGPLDASAERPAVNVGAHARSRRADAA
jgi:predicted GNAT family N-acyltransferase